jgi:hypothetical protein
MEVLKAREAAVHLCNYKVSKHSSETVLYMQYQEPWHMG